MSPSPLVIEPLTGRPDVVISVPGSKSHTNRALICAALARGVSTLEGALFADDTRAMVGALSQLGIDVSADPHRASIRIIGCDGQVPAGPASFDVVQSGTTGRFLACLAALGPGPYVIDGDDQLRARPFGQLVRALRTLGADIDGERLPMTIGGGGLSAGTVQLPGSVSSQFLSGLLMAAPYATPGSDGQEETIIEITDDQVSTPYVALTMATMASFGVKVDHDHHRHFVIGPQRYQARTVDIEPDASAASYFFAAAAITGGRVRIMGLNSETVQGDSRFVDLLEAMGATVRRSDDWIEVEGGRPLRGITIDMAEISDVAQTLAVVAAFATTPTTVTGIGFIKAKETDRVSAVVSELTKLGIRAEQIDDGFIVHPGQPQPATVMTHGDHRMAMSFALFGLVYEGISLDDPDCVAKTFPTYFAVLDQLGSP
ncbi:MAG: 3-phosphoshikimate 1-carboxyvinyltransferase [Actinomycetia bacterium]|nr:3-phosphoshikimate 1-carboxyvinyltransferase [Actinomycetes bacterium]